MHFFLVLAEVSLGNLLRATLGLSGVLENLVALLHAQIAKIFIEILPFIFLAVTY